MGTITKERIRGMLDLHEKWLGGDADGVRANLRGADLEGADLEGADLRDAHLRSADLEGANLMGADLRGTYLEGADLEGADLRDTNLKGANLEGADLEGADLRDANLRDTNLEGADLEGADLRNCILSNNRNPFLIGNFSVGKHLAVATLDYLAIGCEQYKWEYWLSNFERVGRCHNYSDEEIAEYSKLIHTFNAIRIERNK